MNLYLETMNTIEYLKRVLKLLKEYQIPSALYEAKLNAILNTYETEKRKEVGQERKDEEKTTIHLEFKEYRNLELELSLQLDVFQETFTNELLFFRLVKATDDWSLEVEVDDLFSAIQKQNLMTKLASVDLQAFLLKRYHDLLLKKVMLSYQHHDKAWQEYDEIRSYPFLEDSIKRYYNDYNLPFQKADYLEFYLANIVTPEPLEEEVSEKVESPLQETATFKTSTSHWQESYVLWQIKRNAQKKYFFDSLALEEIDKDEAFDYLGKNKKGLVQILGIKKALHRDFRYCNFAGYDLTDVDFAGVKVVGANLAGTNATKNLGMVYHHDFRWTNLEDADLGFLDIQPYQLWGANLKNTGALLLFDSELLDHTNLEECFVLYQDADESILESLKEEYPKTVFVKSLEELYQLPMFAYLGKDRVALIQKLGLKKAQRKDFSFVDFHGLDLSDVNFSNVKIVGANLKDTYAIIEPQKIWEKDFTGCVLSGCYMERSVSDCKNLPVFPSSQYMDIFWFDGRKEKVDNRFFIPDLAYLRDQLANVIDIIGMKKALSKDLRYADFEKIDLEKINFKDVQLEGVRMYYSSYSSFNLEEIKDKNLDNAVITGYLKRVNFRGFSLVNADLRNTLARIHPQECDVSHARLEGCYVVNDFKGYEGVMPDLNGAFLIQHCDIVEEILNEPGLSYIDSIELFEKLGLKNALNKDFTDLASVPIRQFGNTDFRDVLVMGIHLCNQWYLKNIGFVRDKNFDYTDLHSTDLSMVDFTGFSLYRADLSNSGAIIDPDTLKNKDLTWTNLEKCYIITHGDEEKYHYLKYKEVIFLSSYDDLYNLEEIAYLGPNKKEILTVLGFHKAILKNFSMVDFQEVDLSGVDFTDVRLFRTNLTNTRANIFKDSLDTTSNLDTCATTGCQIYDSKVCLKRAL